MNRLNFYKSFSFALRLLITIILSGIIALEATAQVAEIEPNNSFATANAINASTVTSGTVTTSDMDYFSTVLPSDGAVKIYVQATNNGAANGYIYLYGYDSRQSNGQILAKYVSTNSNVTPGQTINDNITLFGRAAAAFYLRLEAAGSFSYTFRYEMVNTSANDAEPNDIFDQSIAINRKQEKQGHTGYTKGGVADPDDFYKTTLPIDGTLKIYVKGTNRNGGNGYMYLYGYDGRQGSGQVLAKYIANNSNVANNETIYDTILLYGRSAGNFYFRLQSAGAFDYSLSYDLTDSSANDIEPNNTFATSLPINRLQELKGHTGYVNNGVADPDDFYKTTLPVDGALKIFIEGTNQNGGPGYMYIYGYDGREASGQVLAKYIANNSNVGAGQTIRDTITLYGRAADVFYFRLQSAGGFSYSIKYDLVEGDVNDVEPNNTFEEPVLLNQLDEKKGHISYVKNGLPDGDEFYKTVIPIDGTLKVYVKGTNKSGSNAYMYMYGYDRRKGSGQIFATYIGGNSNVAKDSSVTDSITIYGVLADTFYFRIQSAGAFDYSIKYNTTPNSQFDEEPNNTFEEAGIFKQGITKTGQVGYQLGGVRDNFDYYKTFLPADGTMKIYVKGTNNSGTNGYMYLIGYDKRQGNGQVFAKYINSSNVAPAATVFDTIYLYGRAADSFYLRFESAGAFSYSFSYDIIDTSANDIEPNNTFDQALPIERLERKRGHTGYLKSGVGDPDDFYVAALPEDGTLKITVKGTNRNGTPGYMYMYVYDGRKASGQILAKYIGTSNVAAGADVFDTIYLHGRAADTIYFRLQSAGAFNYSIDFDISQTSENDVEPNNTFEKSIPINPNEIKKGHIGYVKNGVPDPDDFYKTLIPANGSLKIYLNATNRSGTNAYMYIYGYDGRMGSGQVLAKYVANNSNVLRDSSIIDSITLYGRASDSFYFRIQSAGAFNYSLSYAVTNSPVLDVEPNNIFDQALAIDAGEERKGNIGYVKSGVPDPDDFYKTQLPADGTLKIYVQGKNISGSNGYMYMYGYDSRKGSGQLLAKYVANNSNVINDSTIYDTIYISCRAIDSFYFRIQSAGAFSYSLKYEMITGSADDAEPNNNFATATLLPVSNTANGHIGYAKGGVGDGDDYYKTLLPAKGSLRMIVTVSNTSGANGYVYLYGYDKRKGSGQIYAGYVKNNGSLLPNVTYNDTILLNCVTTDSFYLRVTSAGCFTYSVRFEHVSRQPKADLTYERLGNTFGFRPQLSNANTFIWNFGDGTTSTLQYPMKTYTPGAYFAKLIATNTTCNYKDTAQTLIEVKGVEYYTPKKAGTGGDVVLEVYGGGLDTTAKVKLVKGATTIFPVEKYTNGIKNHLSNIFNLHLVDPGLYDVVIDIPGLPTITYTNGFEVQGFVYPYITSNIQGPSRWRINTNTRFTLVVNNQGNVLANGAVVAMVWPKSVSIKFEPRFIVPPDTGIVTVVVEGKNYSLPQSDYHFIWDSLNTITPIDSFAGQPYDGYIRYLLIPFVPANSTIEFPFIARTTVAGGINLKTFSLKPNLRGSNNVPNWQNNTDDLTAEFIDGADMIIDKTNVPPLKVLIKTAKIGQKHAGSLASFAGKHFWAWYDGYEVDADAAMNDWLQETEANNAFALQTATDELGNYFLDKGIGKLNKTYQTQVDFINKRLANNPAMSAALNSKYLDKLNALTGSNKRLNGLKELYKNTKDLGSLSDKLLKLQQLAADCPELEKQLEDLKKELDKELNHRDPKDKPTNPVVFMDPNEITGPIGQGANNYLNKIDKQHFQVSFENLESATAAAQIVYVRDTIDKTKYDINSFEFRGISVGTQYFKIPKDRTQFVIDRKVNAIAKMRVRINGSLDTAKGIITWQFTAIDSATGDIPVFEGFLPPNTTKPNGEGTVSYTLRPIDGLPTGTVFSNRASIVFDQNEPILTNTWQNILDIAPPASNLSLTTHDSIIRLQFTGSDAQAGVGYYNLHVRINGGQWVDFAGTNADTMELIAKTDTAYSFYVTAQDKVGNLEAKAANAEATTIIFGSLPVTMLPLNGTKEGAINRLHWITASENKNKGFSIERSNNGREFTPINFVATKAAGGFSNTQLQYDYPDAAAPKTAYYRLVQTDLDGRITYSNVVKIDRNKLMTISVYPNPAHGNIRVVSDVNITSLQLTDMSGRAVKWFTPSANNNYSLLGLKSGVYILQIAGKDGQEQVKIIVE